MGKRITAVAVAVAIAVGGLTVAALNPLGVAGARTTTTDQAGPASGAGKEHGRGRGRGHRDAALTTALDKLVADGTLTQEQADKVLDAIKTEARAAAEDRKDKRRDHRQETLGVVAEAIGSTPEEVQAGLKDGKSIAEQAEAKGVERQVVADALAKALTARIDSAVADGTLDADRADKAKARVEKLVERILDANGQGLGGRGHGRGHRPGHRGGN